MWRRFFLALSFAATTCVQPVYAQAGAIVERYGTQPAQFGELRVPSGRAPFPVVVLFHGGCWRKSVADLSYMRVFAEALAQRRIATWNVEYRGTDEPGGGYPGTFEDWSASVTRLSTLAQRYPLDMHRVVLVGHSAGATAALYAAMREPSAVSGVLALDGPADLSTFTPESSGIASCARGASDLMGASVTAQPARYRDIDPIDHLPLHVRQIVVPATFAPLATLEPYVTAARKAGDDARIERLPSSDHFAMVRGDTPEFQRVLELIDALLR